MKRDALQVGKSYTDGRGNVRHIIGSGPAFKLYSSQADTDCLRYRQEAKVSGPNLLGHEYNSTRTSFAAWAKSEVHEESAS